MTPPPIIATSACILFASNCHEMGSAERYNGLHPQSMHFIQLICQRGWDRARNSMGRGLNAMKSHDVEVLVVGAGHVGIAAAYFLATQHKRTKLLIVDSAQPMT